MWQWLNWTTAMVYCSSVMIPTPKWFTFVARLWSLLFVLECCIKQHIILLCVVCYITCWYLWSLCVLMSRSCKAGICSCPFVQNNIRTTIEMWCWCVTCKWNRTLMDAYFNGLYVVITVWYITTISWIGETSYCPLFFCINCLINHWCYGLSMHDDSNHWEL